MLRCMIDVNGRFIGSIMAVRQHRMREPEEVNLYDYTIQHIPMEGEPQLFVGQVSHRYDDGAIGLLKKIMEEEAWLVIEEVEDA